MRSTISHEHPLAVVLDLSLHRDSGKTDTEEQSTAEKAATKEEFWGD